MYENLGLRWRARDAHLEGKTDDAAQTQRVRRKRRRVANTFVCHEAEAG